MAMRTLSGKGKQKSDVEISLCIISGFMHTEVPG